MPPPDTSTGSDSFVTDMGRVSLGLCTYDQYTDDKYSDMILDQNQGKPVDE